MKLSVGPRGSWAISTLVWGQNAQRAQEAKVKTNATTTQDDEPVPSTLRSPHLWWVAEAVETAKNAEEDDEDDNPITSSEIIALFV